MRISDWSSDVCSSDLARPEGVVVVGAVEPEGVDPGGLAPGLVAEMRRRLDGTPRVARDHHGLAAQLLHRVPPLGRSAERRVGKECVSTGVSRWSPFL